MKSVLMLDRVIDQLKRRIESYGLQLLDRYPNDLLVHDRRILERLLVPGITLGWVVGDMHTHLVTLGLHPGENEMAPCLARLSENDRFHTITVDYRCEDNVAIQEISREAFAALVNTDVPYRSNGPVTDFELYRHTQYVGRIDIVRTSKVSENPRYLATITPSARVQKVDRAALQLWAEKSTCKAAGTLFCATEIVWQEFDLNQMAA